MKPAKSTPAKKAPHKLPAIGKPKAKATSAREIGAKANKLFKDGHGKKVVHQRAEGSVSGKFAAQSAADIRKHGFTDQDMEKANENLGGSAARIFKRKRQMANQTGS